MWVDSCVEVCIPVCQCFIINTFFFESNTKYSTMKCIMFDIILRKCKTATWTYCPITYFIHRWWHDSVSIQEKKNIGQVDLHLAQKSMSLTALRSRSDGIGSACLDGNRCNWCLYWLVQTWYSHTIHEVSDILWKETTIGMRLIAAFLVICTFVSENYLWIGSVSFLNLLSDYNP